jgi:hypothetical protein
MWYNQYYRQPAAYLPRRTAGGDPAESTGLTPAIFLFSYFYMVRKEVEK